MGKIEIDHTGSGSGITLSSDGTSFLLDGSAIGGSGGGADLYDANEANATGAAAKIQLRLFIAHKRNCYCLIRAVNL